MDIKISSSLFFPSYAKGIVLDDAYDLYMRNRYIEYVKEKHINFIQSQDLDMNLLSYFTNIEFLCVPKDAINLENLYQLKNLRGIQICADELNKIDLTRFEHLEWLKICGEPKYVESICECKKLKNVECSMWKSLDFTKLGKLNMVKKLSVVYFNNLSSLDGLEYLDCLEELTLEYCLKLRDINKLKDIAENLKILNITDCNKIEDLNILGELINLESLKLTTFQTHHTNKLGSLKFINNMKKLKKFMTDYRVVDKDLSPLLKVEKVDVLKFFKGYNLTGKEFLNRRFTYNEHFNQRN